MIPTPFARRNVLSCLAAAALAACGSSSTSGPVKPGAGAPGASYVLVHGAWMGAWSWDSVAAKLRAQGATVTAVELPGHGADSTPVSGATLDAYVAKVNDAIAKSSGKVVLVGHSMAGIVISEVAEQHPEKLDRVIYLAAYVPKSGQTLQELAGTDAASHVGPALQIDGAAGLAKLAGDKLGDIFCADCSPESMALLRARYRDEPLPAFAAPVTLTPDRWGAVAKYYIYTTRDQAVSYDLQQRMTAGVTWAGSAKLETSHAPLLSNPELVASTLAQLAGTR